MPFAEHYVRIELCLRRCLQSSDPETLARIAAAGERTWQNWIAVHNAVARDDISLVLTMREFQVASFAADGCSNAEISLRLDMAEAEARAVLRSVYRKLSIKNRAELRRYTK